MAQKVQVILVDDLDGGQADETVAFSLDGTDYEIDLSNEHAQELRGAFDRYLQVARKAQRVFVVAAPLPARSRARQQMLFVSGRVPMGSTSTCVVVFPLKSARLTTPRTSKVQCTVECGPHGDCTPLCYAGSVL